MQIAAPAASRPAFPPICVGACGGADQVTVTDLIRGVSILLGLLPASDCPEFVNAEGMVTVARLTEGVINALSGCASVVTF